MKDTKKEPSKKRISVQAAKSKGRRLQKYVAEKLSEITGIPQGKDCLIQSREMGQSGTDVKLIGEALEKILFSIECKYCESWSVHSWIEQAKANQLPNTEWLLFAKRNRSNPVVIMDAEVFFKLFGEIYEKREHTKVSRKTRTKSKDSF